MLETKLKTRSNTASLFHRTNQRHTHLAKPSMQVTHVRMKRSVQISNVRTMVQGVFIISLIAGAQAAEAGENINAHTRYIKIQRITRPRPGLGLTRGMASQQVAKTRLFTEQVNPLRYLSVSDNVAFTAQAQNKLQVESYKSPTILNDNQQLEGLSKSQKRRLRRKRAVEKMGSTPIPTATEKLNHDDKSSSSLKTTSSYFSNSDNKYIKDMRSHVDTGVNILEDTADQAKNKSQKTQEQAKKAGDIFIGNVNNRNTNIINKGRNHVNGTKDKVDDIKDKADDIKDNFENKLDQKKETANNTVKKIKDAGKDAGKDIKAKIQDSDIYNNTKKFGKDVKDKFTSENIKLKFEENKKKITEEPEFQSIKDNVESYNNRTKARQANLENYIDNWKDTRPKDVEEENIAVTPSSHIPDLPDCSRISFTLDILKIGKRNQCMKLARNVYKTLSKPSSVSFIPENSIEDFKEHSKNITEHASGFSSLFVSTTQEQLEDSKNLVKNSTQDLTSYEKRLEEKLEKVGDEFQNKSQNALSVYNKYGDKIREEKDTFMNKTFDYMKEHSNKTDLIITEKTDALQNNTNNAMEDMQDSLLEEQQVVNTNTTKLLASGVYSYTTGMKNDMDELEDSAVEIINEASSIDWEPHSKVSSAAQKVVTTLNDVRDDLFNELYEYLDSVFKLDFSWMHILTISSSFIATVTMVYVCCAEKSQLCKRHKQKKSRKKATAILGLDKKKEETKDIEGQPLLSSEKNKQLTKEQEQINLMVNSFINNAPWNLQKIDDISKTASYRHSIEIINNEDVSGIEGQPLLPLEYRPIFKDVQDTIEDKDVEGQPLLPLEYRQIFEDVQDTIEDKDVESYPLLPLENRQIFQEVKYTIEDEV